MAKKFLVNIDLNGNQLINTYANGLVVENASADGQVSIRSIQNTGGKGQLYYNTTASGLYYYDGAAWKKVANTGDVATASATNITGTASAGTFYPIFSTGSGTGLTLYADSGNNLTYNPSTDLLTTVGLSATNASVGTASIGTGGLTSTVGNTILGAASATSASIGANGLTVAGNTTLAAASATSASIGTGGLTSTAGNTILGAASATSASIGSGGLTSTAGNTILGAASATSASLSGALIAVGNISSSGSLAVTSSVTAASFGGNGAALTSLTGGNVTGSVTSALTSASVTVNNDISTAVAQYIAFTAASTGGAAIKTTAASLTYIPSTGVLAAPIFSGNGSALTSLTGANVTGSVTAATNAASATTALNATNVAVTNDTSTSTAQYITFTSASTGNTGIKTTAASLSYIPSTGVLAAPIFSGNGSALTSLTAGNLLGTIPASVLGNSTHYVGTTAIALNRASANQALTGILNIVMPGTTSGSITLVPTAIAGTASLTLPATTGTVALTSDIQNATITVNASAGALINGTSTDSFTLNQSGAKTLAITTNGTSANTVSTLVQRDGSGNFSAGTITATLTGIASSATNLAVTTASTNATTYIPFFSANSSTTQAASVTASLSFNPSTGVVTAASFSGAHSGNGSGLTSLTAANLTGSVAIANGGTNASATPNTNGVFYFDGTRYTSTASGAANSILISSAGVPAFAASGTVSVGTAASATNLALTTASQNATTYIPFFSANSTSTQAASVTAGLQFNPSTNTLTATTFSGALSGNATTATTATHIAGGAANRVPYNTGAGTTAFVAAPTAASSVLAYTSTNAFGYVSYDSASTANTIAVRDANGRMQVADPSSAADVANKNYVDSVAQGLNAHAAVVAATASADVLSASYVDGTSDSSGGLGIGAYLEGSANGVFPTVDGNVTLVVNDRFLVKSYTGTSAVWNGVYTLTASGAVGSKWRLTRSADTNNSTAGEFAYGDYFFVVSGSTQAGTGWVVTTKGTGTPANTIKIGTDQVTLSQFSGQGTILAGDGISISGNTISFRPSATGGLQNSSASASIKLATNSGLSTDANGLTVGVGTGLATSTGSVIFNSGTTAQSGTGVSTPSSWTYATQKQAFTITGNGVFTSTTLTHNLNSTDILVQVYESSTGQEVELDITRTSASVVTLTWAQAPSNGTVYKAVLMG